MTVISNTFTRYSAIGNKEDLANTIYNLAPTDTPVMNAIGQSTAMNTLHEWQTDTLRAAAQNAQIEGDQYTNSTRTPTVRVSNYTQIFTEIVGVTGTQLAMNPAGRTNELAYQMQLASKALKTDIEYNMMNNQAPGNGTDGSTGRTMRPFPSWIATNIDKASDGSNGSSSTARTDGTQRAFTEDQLKGVLKSIYDNSNAQPSMIVAGSFNRGVFSTFTGGNNRQQYMDEKKLTATVQVYEGDFGVYKVVADRFMRTRDVFVLTPEYAAIAYLRPFEVQDVAKVSDSERKAIVAELTLEMRNEKAHGAIYDAQ
jgi:hypothetical protein